MKKNTKIVATISDRKCDTDFIKKLHLAGMNVVRLNTAHQNEEDTLKVINNVRAVSDKIALLLDTKGPEIRTTETDEDIKLSKGDEILISGGPGKKSSRKHLFVSYANFVNELKEGRKILIDDGYVEIEVIQIKDDVLHCKALNDGVIESRKSVNVPKCTFDLPSLSEKDRRYIHFAIEHDIDFIAHSFVRKKEDILAIQEILDEHKSKIKIISKIENQEGVDNIEEILNHSYGIMVARGDLAIEIPYEKIPSIQKMLIEKCITRRKPVIIATQMLHTMIHSPRPTRAEVSDIANAIYSKTDAIMLSGETAYGDYPVEAVDTMAKVAAETEKSRSDYHDIPSKVLSTPISAFLSKSAVNAASQLKAKAIIADTMSGRTIRNMASYRGKRPIFAQCGNKRVMRELQLTFGAFPEYTERIDSTHDFIHNALESLIEMNHLKTTDLVVVIAGNLGRSHGASYIEISSVEKLLKH